MGEREAKELLSSYGIPVTKERLAVDLQDALRTAAEIGYPVAVKIDSPDILHKTEVGGFIWARATPMNSRRRTNKSPKALL